MPRPFRNATCAQCRKDYSYKYTGGRTRKYCLTCKPKKRAPSLNAYDFDWGPLSPGWHLTKHRGNVGKWFGQRFGVVHTQAGFFVFWRPRQLPIKSNIVAATENVPEALAWAETGMQNMYNTF